MAPVVGSGCCPEWIALVSNPSDLLVFDIFMNSPYQS